MSSNPLQCPRQSWVELSLDQAAEKLASLSVENMEKQAAPTLLQQIYSKLQDAGSSAKDWYLAQDPTVQWGVPGAAIGGAIGGLSSYSQKDKDRQTLRNILLGITAGGLTGAGIGLANKGLVEDSFKSPVESNSSLDAGPVAEAENLIAKARVSGDTTGVEDAFHTLGVTDDKLLRAIAQIEGSTQIPTTGDYVKNMGTGAAAGAGAAGVANVGARVAKKMLPESRRALVRDLMTDAQALTDAKITPGQEEYLKAMDDLATKTQAKHTADMDLSRKARLKSKIKPKIKPRPAPHTQFGGAATPRPRRWPARSVGAAEQAAKKSKARMLGRAVRRHPGIVEPLVDAKPVVPMPIPPPAAPTEMPLKPGTAFQQYPSGYGARKRLVEALDNSGGLSNQARRRVTTLRGAEPGKLTAKTRANLNKAIPVLGALGATAGAVNTYFNRARTTPESKAKAIGAARDLFKGS